MTLFPVAHSNGVLVNDETQMEDDKTLVNNEQCFHIHILIKPESQDSYLIMNGMTEQYFS